MCVRKAALSALIALASITAVATAPKVSPQQADAFARKLAIISAQSTMTARAATARRTSVSEDEVNSWFAYRAQPMLPDGVTQPQLTIIGNGKVAGMVTVDLDAIAKQKRTSGILNPWNLIGGRVPVVVSGVLHTQNGRGQFDVEDATVSGLPVPTSLLQELVSHYSKTAEDPDGFRLADPFELPAHIRQIEVGQGQAVVIQ
jgi:hypothetical protein